MTDEKTSPELATLAGRMLNMSDDEIVGFAAQHPASIRSLVASLLTQARDRKPPEPPPKRWLPIRWK